MLQISTETKSLDLADTLHEQTSTTQQERKARKKRSHTKFICSYTLWKLIKTPQRGWGHHEKGLRPKKGVWLLSGSPWAAVTDPGGLTCAMSSLMDIIIMWLPSLSLTSLKESHSLNLTEFLRRAQGKRCMSSGILKPAQDFSHTHTNNSGETTSVLKSRLGNI